MLASYRLIQYLPDRMFPAPVTVGIAAWTAGETRLRIIGFDVATNQPQTDVFRRAFDLPPDAEPMLLEWIRWFQDVVGQRGRFDEMGVPLLEHLESKDFPFVASQAGEADIETRELDAFADDLFRRAVLALPQIRHAHLEQAALNCLVAAGLTKAAGSLIEDAEIELPKTSAGRGLLNFAWFLDQGRDKVGFRLLDFEEIESAVGRQVADALNTFEAARTRELLRRGQCFVLHGPGLDNYAQYAELLGEAATLIDLSNADAAGVLRAALRST